MNDNDASKLRTILTNIMEKCNGIDFYHVELDGRTCTLFERGAYGIAIEVETTGETIYVEDISQATFDSDIYFAEFVLDDGTTHGVNITKDIPPQQIFAELG